MSTSSFAVAILAAGASSRMGQPKMLLPWGATTVLGHLLTQWREVGAAQVAVVCADGASGIDAELDRLGVARAQRILNPSPERGMFSSIQCAAAWNEWPTSVQHIGIVLGDQPHLAVATLRAVVQFAAAHPRQICQPSRAGRPRHPVFLPRELFATLAHSPHQTLKEFLAPHAAELRLVELNDPGLDCDLDTPADYERAVRMFRSA